MRTDTHEEPHTDKSGKKLNWLRAAVLGANNGIVSTAGLVVGVAGATSSNIVIFAAGIAGVSAGALSMAVGEYVSVSSQRDTEKALLEKEKRELEEFPELELKELEGLYRAKGLSAKTAKIVAKELTEKDAFAAHVDAELGIDPEELTNPIHAAVASALSFLVGAIIPLLAIMLFPQPFKVPLTFIAVLVALALTGIISAQTGGAKVKRATIRVVLGGAIAMVVTYSIGKLFGVSV